MKKQYSEPKLLILSFIQEDIITSSTGNANGLDTDSNSDFNAAAYDDLFVETAEIFVE
ncbi:MAG: hypothetical protein ACI4CT_07745 [Lachnospiraceae bacterium]